MNSAIRLGSVLLFTGVLLSCSATPVKYAGNPRVITRDLTAELPPRAVVRESGFPERFATRLPVTMAVVTEPQLPRQAVEVAQTVQAAQTDEKQGEFDVAAQLGLGGQSVFVDFANESTSLSEAQIPLEQLKAMAKPTTHFFVIGQSHGLSAIGTNRLASQRAEKVAAALRAASVDPSRVHMLASWSGTRQQFAPPRGVNIVVVEESSQQWNALLMLTNEPTTKLANRS
jgi:hypothetical protein